MVRPRVFIGSSVESLKVAEAFADKIRREAEGVLWSESTFKPSEYTIDGLLRIAKTVDFAVIVLGKDDLSISRGLEKLSPRDNVIFELGLFMGMLSRERVFFLVPESRDDLKIPSDLLGITPLEYDANRSDGKMINATGAAAREFLEVLEEKGKLLNDSNVAASQSSVGITSPKSATIEVDNTEFAKKK